MIKVTFRFIKAFIINSTTEATTDAKESLKSKSIPRYVMLATYIRSEEATTKKIIVYINATNKTLRLLTLSIAIALNTKKSTSKMIVQSKKARNHLL